MAAVKNLLEHYSGQKDHKETKLKRISTRSTLKPGTFLTHFPFHLPYNSFPLQSCLVVPRNQSRNLKFVRKQDKTVGERQYYTSRFKLISQAPSNRYAAPLQIWKNKSSRNTLDLLKRIEAFLNDILYINHQSI